MEATAIDLRQQRGLDLVKGKGKRIRQLDDNTWLVPSATNVSGGYVVDVASGSCSCPDHEDRGVKCKHLWAVAYFRHEVTLPDGTTIVTEQRITYSQDWSAYNRAQCEEKERVQVLLRGLCDGIVQPRQAEGKRHGRRRLPLADVTRYRRAVPYVPFKSNSQPDGSEAWRRLWHLYSFKHDEFLAHYHKRSNVESTFSMIKRKFGTGVRAKLLPAQLNEVLLKCLCHNLSVLVHSIHELGIEPKFWLPAAVH
jgi:hypothetical protein